MGTSGNQRERSSPCEAVVLTTWGLWVAYQNLREKKTKETWTTLFFKCWKQILYILNSLTSGNTGPEMKNTFLDKGKFKGFFFFLVRRTSLKVHHKKTLRQRRHDARRKTGRLGVKGKNREDRCLNDYQRCFFCYDLLKTVFMAKNHCMMGFSVCEDATNFHILLERLKYWTKVCINACQCVYTHWQCIHMYSTFHSNH